MARGARREPAHQRGRGDAGRLPGRLLPPAPVRREPRHPVGVLRRHLAGRPVGRGRGLRRLPARVDRRLPRRGRGGLRARDDPARPRGEVTGVFRAEAVKLKRSSIWIIAVLLPLLAVVTGTINLANNTQTLDSGWASFTSQVVLFYGLLFYSMGISLLAAAIWRVEHRGTNWNALLTATARPIRLVLAKIVAILVPVALMQAVLVGGTAVSGLFVLRLDGPFPVAFLLVGLIATVAALPLIAVQSLLSLLLRSFAAPVALCLVGCVAGVAAVTSAALRPLAEVLPQAINTRALNLGSTAIAGSGGLTAADTLPLLATSVGLVALVVLLTLAAIRVVKLR
nr:ABC transporter permease [Clavibacter michiganensis]